MAHSSHLYVDPFWLMSIFKALEAFYFLTNMTWEVFGMSGKFKLFQW